MLRIQLVRTTIAAFACSAALLAQSAPQAGVAPDIAAADAANPQFNDPPPPPPGYGPPPSANAQAPTPPQGPMSPNVAMAPSNLPPSLTLAPGAMITVRVNQWLSSDRNVVGDQFYATLAQPLIVNGVVVAPRGATVTGRVSEVKKSHVDSPSRLAVQLTSLSLADGQQIPIQSQAIDRTGTTVPAGQQAGAVVGTTAVGAGIGAIAGGGVGAAIGAGIGLVAGSAGVMATRGRPTEIYPETMMSFRVDAPVTISTVEAPAAFHYASQDDYGVGRQARVNVRPPAGPGAPPPPGYAAPYSVYPYPYGYYPYGYPGISVYVGPRFYGYRGFRRW